MSNTANSSYQTKHEQKGLAFDPRTRILLLIELDILLFLGRSLAYEACVFLFCAFILLVGSPLFSNDQRGMERHQNSNENAWD